MATVYMKDIGDAVQGVSIDSNRRLFNFGDRVAELAPQQSPFFVYLNKVAKRPTDDPVFKFLEQRHQWQRRTFQLAEAAASATYTADTTELAGDVSTTTGITVDCLYDKSGRPITTAQGPEFVLAGQIVAIADTTGTPRRFRIKTATVSAATSLIDCLALEAGTYAFADNAEGVVIGSAFVEGTGVPDGWVDSLYDREGYTQIFKTAIPLFTGSTLATRYRAYSNEFRRVWQEKLMEHKMDIEQALLFGIGRYAAENGTIPKRYTWGILPYVETNGNVFNFTYASTDYDAFLDAMESFYAPESANSGDKLVLASRKIITWFNKIGTASFLNNTVGSSQYRLDIQQVKGAFGHQVTRVNTIFGNLHFVQEPLLRGMWEDYAVAVDMKNVAYRPLAANGMSRDTFIETNVQAPDIDGRIDQILTESGLEVSLPETHAVMKWS